MSNKKTVKESVRYLVQLDGDYVGEYPTKRWALSARREEFGHVAPENRRVWKEITRVISTEIDWRDYE